MANQITGKILHIYPTQDIPCKDGNSIKKRSIVMDLTRFDPYTGERSQHENTPELEFTGDRCRELDAFRAGQVVTVSFDVQGTRYRNRDGAEQIFTRIRPYKIEAKQAAASAQAPQQQPPQQARQQVVAPPVSQGWPDNNLPF